MAKSGTRLALVYLHLYFLTGQTTANIWRPIISPTLPTDPNDPYYQAFRMVPSAQTTANKFVKNFLHFSPSTVTKRQTSVEDVVAVLDGSGSIGSCEFEKGKKALNILISTAAKNSTFDPQYAAVTFADSAVVNFNFLKYSAAARHVKKIRYPSGMTNTQAGLSEALKLLTSSGSGVRPFGRKAVLLITDGQSNVQSSLTIPKAKALKGIGVFIYVIAVGGTFISGIDEMVKVASRPPQYYLYRVRDLSGLVKVMKLVVKQVAPGKYKIINGQPNKPCVNRG